MAIERQKIIELITPVLNALGFVLWQLDLQNIKPRPILRIFIDHQDNSAVTLDDCSLVSEQLGAVLDVEEAINGSYTLEVSSCGLARVLITPEHYKKYIGSSVEIYLYAPRERRKHWTGILVAVGEDGITLAANGEQYVFVWAEISKANLIPEL